MKTATALFLNKLLYPKAGEYPIYLVRIYTGTRFLYFSTERLISGIVGYEPYIKEFGAIRMGFEDELDSLAPPNEIEIVLLRNATTEQLLRSDIKYRQVRVRMIFDGLTSADELIMGVFLIDEITDIKPTTITIRCISDETKFEIDKPQELLNKTDYPLMLDEYKDQCWPLVLGDMQNPAGNTNRYLDTYLTNAVPIFCVDKNDYKFLIYRHAIFNCQAPVARAYKLEEESRLYSQVYSTHLGANNFSLAVVGVSYELDLNVFSETYYGNERRVRLLPTHEDAAINNVTDWQNACDKDPATDAHLTATENILYLNFDIIEGIGNFIPSGWTDTAYYTIRTGVNINAIGGTVVVTLIHPLGSTLMGTYTTTGYKESAAAWSNPGGGVLELNRFAIKVQLTGTSASIDGTHLLIGYYDNMDVVRVKREDIRPVSKEKAVRRRRSLTGGIDLSPEWKGGTVYIEALGPPDWSGQGWYYYLPPSMLYFYLVYVLGMSSANIDITSFNAINTAMISGWKFGVSLCQKWNPKDFCDQLCRESGLKMWQDSNDKFRLYRVNSAAASPNMSFTDQAESVYLMKDFNWGYLPEFFNRYELNYKKDYGKNEFQLNYLKDRNNDADLAGSYSNYSSTEKDYPFPDLEFIRDLTVIELLYALLTPTWKRQRVWVEFTTSAVGCLLELGDTIRTNHSCQTWATTVNFQVSKLEYSETKVKVRAIEVVT